MIESLRGEVQELRAEVQALRSENEELHARLNRDSSNSSQPPSSDPPWKAPDKRRGGRKRGGQPGHRGHKRELVEPDEVVEHRPESCVRCRHALSGDDPNPLRHQVAEVPPIATIVTEHRIHRLRCRRCGKLTSAALPPGVPRGAFGPRLMSIIAACSGAYRMSKRSIVELMQDFFGARISLGSISRVEERVSAALAKPVGDALAHIKNARVVHVDETGWFVRSLRAWLWTAVTSRVVVFMIRGSRSRDTSYALVPQSFRGVTVADGYAAYDWIHPDRRQLCWAHLIRNFRELLDYGEVAKVFAEQILAAIDRMFDRWHSVRGNSVATVNVALNGGRSQRSFGLS